MIEDQDDLLDQDGGGTELDDSGESQEQMGPPAPSPAMNPVVAAYLQNKSQGQQGLADAQDQASRNQLISGIGRAAGTFAHALSGSSKPVDDSAFNMLDAQAQNP